MRFSSIKPTPKSIGSSIPLKPQRDVTSSSNLAWIDLGQLAAYLIMLVRCQEPHGKASQSVSSHVSYLRRRNVPGLRKDSPLRAFTKLLGDTSVQRVIKSTQLGNALNRAIGHQDRLYLAMRRFAPNGGRFFRHGWGDIARAEAFRAEALECVSTQQFSYDELVQPEITHIATRKDYKVISYRAESPWANGYHKSLTHSLSKSSPPSDRQGR